MRMHLLQEDSAYELEDQTSKALILPLLLKMLHNASRGLFVYHLHQNTTKGRLYFIKNISFFPNSKMSNNENIPDCLRKALEENSE